MSINLLYQEVYENCGPSLKEDLNRSFFSAKTIGQFMNSVTEKKDWVTIAKFCNMSKPLVLEFFLDLHENNRKNNFIHEDSALVIRCLAALKTDKAKKVLIDGIPDDPDDNIFIATLLWLYLTYGTDSDVLELFKSVYKREDVHPNLRDFVKRVLVEGYGINKVKEMGNGWKKEN